jgi:hypothetical protein
MFPSSTHFAPRRVLHLAFLLGALAAGGAMAQAAPDASSPAVTPATPPAPQASMAPQLTAELVYRVLVGDIALQRGAPALAARAYFEAARDAQDAQLARRATEVALFARQRDLALEAARLWARLDPSADRARQMVATLSMPAAT